MNLTNLTLLLEFRERRFSQNLRHARIFLDIFRKGRFIVRLHHIFWMCIPTPAAERALSHQKELARPRILVVRRRRRRFRRMPVNAPFSSATATIRTHRHTRSLLLASTQTKALKRCVTLFRHRLSLSTRCIDVYRCIDV